MHRISDGRSMWRGKPNFGLSLLVGFLLFVANAPAPIAAPPKTAADLLIVDCLLPGQVRKLGRVSTYMTARKPMRTAQSDCEIRGGEYVAYDRANYRTALTVWLAQAELGDAAAQNNVGDIYAKGMGIASDYVKAAAWYEKAVAQNNKQAMVNLGYLHEQGLGVAKDLPRALNLYRQAAGISGDDLVFASNVTISAEAEERIKTLESTLREEKTKSRGLQDENERLRRQLSEKKTALQHARQEVEKARTSLVEKQAQLANGTDGAKIRQLQQQLAQQEQQSAQEKSALESESTAFKRQIENDREKLRQLEAEAQSLDQRLASQKGQAETKALQADRDRVRLAAADLALALDGAVQKSTELEAKLAANERALQQEQTRFEQARKKMQEAVSASKQDRELLLLLEQQLTEKQRQVMQQQTQIALLERQVGSEGSASGSIAATAGPLLEIIEPPLTLARGRPAAMAQKSVSGEILGKVIAKAGLSKLEVNGQTVAVGANGLFRVAVPIKADGSDVLVTAIDQQGKRARVEFLMIPPTSPRDAVASSAYAPPISRHKMPTGVPIGRYYALVIGNDQYRAYPALQSAVKDAESISTLLQNRYRFSVKLLKNASQIEMLSALNQLHGQLKPQDNLLIYFAGHGELSPDRQGYWIPSDGKPKDPATWISNRAISDVLSNMQAKHVLVIADSCYSGAMTRASLPAFNQALSDTQWVQWVDTMAKARSRTALSSGGLAPVPDSGSQGHSLFAKAVLNSLEDNNQILDTQRLFREVSATLALATAQTDLAQTPQYAPIQFSGHEAGDFFFVPKS